MNNTQLVGIFEESLEKSGAIRIPCEVCDHRCKKYGYCPVISAHKEHKISTLQGAVKLMKSLGMCHPDMEVSK